MKTHLLTFLFFSFCIFPLTLSAQGKNLKFSNISFIEKDSITNLEEFGKGTRETSMKIAEMMKPFSEAVMESVGGKMPEQNDDKYKKLVDSLINNFSQSDFDKGIKVSHYQFVDKSIWKRWETKANGDTLTYPVFTDIAKGKEYSHYPEEGRIEYEYSYIFDKVKNLKIKEFRKKQKKINNLSCFRIQCTYQVIISHEGLREISGDDYPDEIVDVESEMWVTEDIQSIYHPVLKVKEILEKYYPLRIEEKISAMPGMVRIKKVKNINF